MELAKKDLAGVQKGAWGLGGSLPAVAVKENSQHPDEGTVSHYIHSEKVKIFSSAIKLLF